MTPHQHPHTTGHSQNQPQMNGQGNPHTSPSPIQHHAVHSGQGGPQNQIPGGPQQMQQPPSTSTPGPVYNTLQFPPGQHVTPTSPLHALPPGTAAHYPYPQAQNMMLPNLTPHQQLAYVQQGQPPNSMTGSAQPGSQSVQQQQQVNHQSHHHNQGVPIATQQQGQQPQILMMTPGQQAPQHLQQLQNPIQGNQGKCTVHGRKNVVRIGYMGTIGGVYAGFC